MIPPRLTRHQERGFVLVGRRIYHILGYGEGGEGWHRIEGSNWRDSPVGQVMLLLQVPMLILFLAAAPFVRSPVIPVLAILIALVIALEYLLLVREDPVVTGYARAVPQGLADVREGLVEGLRSGGLQHRVFEDVYDYGTAVLVDGGVAVYMMNLMEGTAVHVGPLKAGTRELVDEVRGMVDRVVESG